MRRASRLRPRTVLLLSLFALTGVAAWVLLAPGAIQSFSRDSSPTAGLRATGSPQLISIDPLPESDGEMCQWTPASSPERLVSLVQRQKTGAKRPSVALNRPPERVIHDPYPTYSAVALDTTHHEIVLQDENLFQIMTYDEKSNTPPRATMTEPKRVIGGPHTEVEFNCGLYVDPKTGDIYSVNNDTLDKLVVFSRQAKGDVPPDRELNTPHRTYGIAVDESKNEMYMTVESPPMVVVYNKYAKGHDKPLRILRGNKTQLQDAHGIGIDAKRGLMFVANYGNVADYKDGGGDSLPGRSDVVPGSGKYGQPSITVYPLDARGDTAPLRVIAGSKTGLNWPAHLFVDEKHGEVYVANDGTHSILVFHESDNGNVAPARVLGGPKTLIKNPTGVVVDLAKNELIVGNMGDHMATVYPRTASGDVAPIRTIRGAPRGTPALQIGNPGAVAYDSKREQILVPN